MMSTRKPLFPLASRAPLVALLLCAVQATAFAQPAQPADPAAVFSSSRIKFSQQGGETLYRAICQGCHMPQGQGAQGAGVYPTLARNPRLAASGYPLYVVMKGLHGMPGFADRLDDQQVSDVVNFVRNSFGNTYADAVQPADVQAMRAIK